MKKLNIQAKIHIAFIIMFLFMMLGIIYFFWQLNTISEHTRTLYEHPYKVSNAIREMKTEIYLNEDLARNIRLTDNDRQLDSLKAEIDVKNKGIQEGFRIVHLKYLGRKATVDSAFATYNAWKITCNKLYQLKKDNKTDSLQILIEQNIIVKFNSLVYLLNIISDFAEKKADNTFKEVVKAEENSIITSVILLLISCILVVFFIWFIPRSIARPIKTFVSEANLILKKDGTAKVIADEQILIQTLAELKIVYQSIESQNKEIELKNNQLAGINIELEDKVKQRTAELNNLNEELAILYESSRHLASIVESSEDAIVSKSLDGTIKSWNNAAEKMFGYTSEEAIGEYISMIIPPEYINEDNNILDKIKKGEIIHHYQTIRMKKSGERFHVSHTVSPLKDWNGNVVGTSKIIRDITEQHHAEEEIKKMESLMSEGQKIAHMGTFEYLADTNTTIWSEEEFCIYGYDPAGPSPAYDVMLAKSIHPDDAALLHQTFTAAIQSGTVYELEHRIVRPDGSLRWVYDRAQPYFDQNGKLVRYVGSTLDITERKSAENIIFLLNETLEKRVAERTEQLETANNELKFRLSELEQFSYVSNHDLREPLRTLTQFTQLFNEKYAGRLDEDGEQYIEFISRAAMRMKVLVTDLLDYSLLGKESIKTIVDCNKIVNAVLGDLDDSIKGSDAKLTVQMLPTLNGYETELRLLFQNLVGNAIKYQIKGITPEISISAESHEKNWLFSIKDNGIGIDEKYKDKIFIIFQRLHNRNEFEGTGIGLAHCKKIVEMHSGKIWVESTPGAGSVFMFTIPK
ncbi:MAG: PAS domain S-box protein [bacterium]